MFWEIFVRLCQERGEAPNAVAHKVGVKSTGTVSAWKKGALPRDGVLAAMADYFGVSTDFLTGENADGYIFGSSYELARLEKKYSRTADVAEKAELAQQIDTLRESIEDMRTVQRIQSVAQAPEQKEKPTSEDVGGKWFNNRAILNRVLTLIDDQGLNDKDVEQALGLARSTIYKWKSGANESYTHFVPQFAEYFNVSEAYLRGDTDDPDPTKVTAVLNNAQLALLADYDALDEAGRADLLALAKALVARRTSQDDQ